MRIPCVIRSLAVAVLLVSALAIPKSGTGSANSATASAHTTNDAAGIDLAASCTSERFNDHDQPVLTCFVTVTNISTTPLESRKSYLILEGSDGTIINQDDALLDLTDHADQAFRAGATLQKDEAIEGYRAWALPAPFPPDLHLTFQNTAGGRRDESNETSVIFTSDQFAITPLEKTKVALERELSAAQTAAAPTITPVPTWTPSPTPSPTLQPDEATIIALQTDIAAVKSGTPARTKTATPRPTATSTPAPTATIAVANLPESLQVLAEEDSTTRCDHIGWNAVTPDFETPPDFIDNYDHYGACSGDLTYAVSCTIASSAWVEADPPLGEFWIACNLVVFNRGDTASNINPYQFVLFDARGVQHLAAQPVYGSEASDQPFLGGPVQPNDYLQGILLFSAAEGQEEGAILQLGQPEDMRSGQDAVVFLLDPLP